MMWRRRLLTAATRHHPGLRRFSAGVPADQSADFAQLVLEIAARSQQPVGRIATALAGKGKPPPELQGGAATHIPPLATEPFGPPVPEWVAAARGRGLGDTDISTVTDLLREIRGSPTSSRPAADLTRAYRAVSSMPWRAQELLRAATESLDPTIQNQPLKDWCLAYLHRFGAAGQESSLDMSGTTGSKCAVIVETRPLYSLPFVVRNVVWQSNLAHGAAGGWDLAVVGTPAVHRQLRAELPASWRWRELNIEDYWPPAPAPRPQGVDCFNATTLSPAFWSAFPSDPLMLFFQADTILVRSLTKEDSDRAKAFSFVGAPCPDTNGSLTPDAFCLNGGLSFRWAGDFKRALATGGTPATPEDVWFCNALRALANGGGMAAPLPSLRQCANTFVESPLWADSLQHCLGVHATDKEYLPQPAADSIMATATAPL
eukprot:TRINITY_DN35881_c0_g1_i1.p1 TRINITY_DN35881_c0_g1~~TRINITY_DN35881_c0_g1_i1.p1  ORF type:complete len:431 (+),score=96.59 TRINITY_DN35881_c0_g1_i1:52-1344(+)